MKIVISAPGAKRAIEGSFAMCSSRVEFQHIVDTLQTKLADKKWSFGWVSIPDSGHIPLPNTPSAHWGTLAEEPIK